MLNCPVWPKRNSDPPKSQCLDKTGIYPKYPDKFPRRNPISCVILDFYTTKGLPKFFFSRTIEGARTNRLPNKYISNDKPNCRITNRRWCLKQSPCPAHPRYLASPEYGYVSLLVPFSLPFFPLRSPLQSCSINFRSF
jgi:hypothetical protein